MDEFVDAGILTLGANPAASADEFPDLSGADEGTAAYKTAVSKPADKVQLQAFFSSLVTSIDGEELSASMIAAMTAAEAPAAGEPFSVTVSEHDLSTAANGEHALTSVFPNATRYEVSETKAASHFVDLSKSKGAAEVPDALRNLISTTAEKSNELTTEKDAITAFSYLFGRDGRPFAEQDGQERAHDVAAAGPDGHLPLPTNAETALKTAHAALNSDDLHGLPPDLVAEFHASLQQAYGANGGAPEGLSGFSPSKMPKTDVTTAKTQQTTAQKPHSAPKLNTSIHTLEVHGDSEIVVASCQVHSIAGDVEANLAQIEAILRDLNATNDILTAAGCTKTSSKVHIAVFPELFLTGYHVGPTLVRALAAQFPSGEALSAALSSPLISTLTGSPYTATGAVGVSEAPQQQEKNVLEEVPGAVRCPLLRIAQMAAFYGIAVAISYPEISTVYDAKNPQPSFPCIYNAFTVFDSDGSIAGHYRKTHLWGSAYEKRVFTPGPGPMPPKFVRNTEIFTQKPHLCDALMEEGVFSWCPYIPLYLRAVPRVALGLLVCFDLEFPEAVRSLALNAAPLSSPGISPPLLCLCCLGSGDNAGLSSRKIAATRAVESHVGVLFANFPSEPLPEEEYHADGSRSMPRPVADDAIGVAYSGGTSLFGPDGKVLYSLPAFHCNPAKAPLDSTRQVITSSASRTAQSTLVTERLRARLPAVAPGLARDAEVAIMAFDPFAPQFLADQERNPYLLDRRVDLYRM